MSSAIAAYSKAGAWPALLATAAVSVAQSTREFRESAGKRMIAVADNVASTPVIRDHYADPFTARLALTGASMVARRSFVTVSPSVSMSLTASLARERASTMASA